LIDPLEEAKWLYRAVPQESAEVADVESIGEIHPPRSDRIGDYWQRVHVAGMTDTGYTSWSTDRSLAETAARECSDSEGLSGRITVFKVQIRTLDLEKVFEGRTDEDEYLIEGPVENVEFSENASDEEDDD
jgi:hypothetical protein